MSGIYNEYSDLIYQFLDGEIDEPQQKALFQALSQSPELQSELRQAHELNNSFHIDKSSLAPSAALTAALFSKAGFSNPAETSAPVENNPVPAGFFGKFSAIGWGTVGAILSSAVFYTVINIFNPFGGSPTNVNIADGNSTNSNNLTSALPLVASTETNDTEQDNANNDKPKYIVIEKVITKTDTFFVENSEPASEDIAQNNNKQDFSEKAAIVSFTNKATLPRLQNSAPVINIQGIGSLDTREIPIYQITRSHGKFSLELRGIAGLLYAPERPLINENTSDLNNLALGINYYINHNHSCGVQFGTESLQMYRVVDTKDGLQFKLVPDLLWGGAYYRYTLDPITSLANISPYGEVLVGGTGFGPMGKGIIGIAYNPDGMFSFSAGLEGSFLAYELRKTWKATQKLGFTYSVGIKF